MCHQNTAALSLNQPGAFLLSTLTAALRPSVFYGKPSNKQLYNLLIHISMLFLLLHINRNTRKKVEEQHSRTVRSFFRNIVSKVSMSYAVLNMHLKICKIFFFIEVHYRDLMLKS